MCGIAGKLDFTGSPVEADLLGRMITRLHHRGPDGQCIYRDGMAGLAHARLSIIDLSGGRQPMTNEDENLWITFNGEIFNYLELREELIARGHHFTTRCDTEVIIHAYEEYGPDCVNRFNGQWSFAIWDRRRRELFLSRDRLGVRPLYYAHTAQQFVFGSEIKALLADPEVPRELDPLALDQIFTFWCPVPPRTIFAGIAELPPAHSMLVRDGHVRTWRYWNLDYQPTTANRTTDGAVSELTNLLVDATRLRLRSDVPIGAYLSGGLDSSLTTALIRHFSNAELNSFSVAFDQAEFDESEFQQAVADRLHTQHHSLTCTANDIRDAFPAVIRHTERPILRTAPVPLFLLSKKVRDSGIKVVLTGEGADEMLGGYDIFKEAKIRRFWGRQPDSRIRPQLLKRLYPYLQNIQSQPPAYLKAFFQVRSEDLSSPWFSHLPRWNLTSKLKAFYSPELKRTLEGYDAFDDIERQLPNDYASWDPFCQAQYLETAFLLPGYILSSQGDRVGMAHSVEGRFPFLDYRVAEFAANLPVGWKMRGLNEKWLLKQASQPYVPDVVRQRSKQPYRAPEAACFVGPQGTADYVEELLSPEALTATGLFHPPAVARLVEKVRQEANPGIKDNMALIGILSTQTLIRQFMEPDHQRDPAHQFIVNEDRQTMSLVAS